MRMNPPSPAAPAGAPHPRAQPAVAESTGLPGLRTWRRVYLFVFGCFVLWVVLLEVFSRVFA
jgi:hypothetical protein